jgi:hypothetical protein
MQVFSNLAGIMLSDGVCINLRHAALLCIAGQAWNLSLPKVEMQMVYNIILGALSHAELLASEWASNSGCFYL